MQKLTLEFEWKKVSMSIYQHSSLAIVTVDGSEDTIYHVLHCKCWYRAQGVSCESWWAACLSSCWWSQSFWCDFILSPLIHSPLMAQVLGDKTLFYDWHDRHENFINILILGSLHGAVLCETKEFDHSWLCRTTVKSNLFTGPFKPVVSILIQTEPFVQNWVKRWLYRNMDGVAR